MKKLLLLVAILSASIFVQAQKASPEVRAQKIVAKLGEQLELSDEQEEKIVALFVDQFQNGKVDGKKLQTMTTEEKKAHIQAKKDRRAAFDQQLESILTPEQLTTYQSSKGTKTRKSPVQRKVAQLTEKLGLNAEQQEALKVVFEEQSLAGKKSFKGMTKEEKKAAVKARQTSQKALDDKFKAIFTPEQYASFQQMNEEKKQKMLDKRTKNSALMKQKKIDELGEALSLTPAQKLQVSDLLVAQQAARANRSANKEARKAAREEFDTKMKAVLSAEQYATFQKLQEERREKSRMRGGSKKRER